MALEDIRNDRLNKLARLRELGMDPYPARTARDRTVADFIGGHEALQAAETAVILAGRVTSIREHGAAVFVDLVDGTGKVQAYLEKEKLGDEVFGQFTDLVDSGDIIELSGTAFTTKRGQLSLSVTGWRMLAKSIRPVPDEWFGIKDEDERYRKRYLDILLSADVASRIRRRSKFWNTMRSYLLARDFVEVETPVLETTTGGADARPFVTHHHALDIDVYLRISAGELWQKRLMVAGLPKVFEIGRIFRNEGMSYEHAQDYTQLEFYQAFSDYEEGMRMIVDMYRTIADEVYGTRVFTVKDHTFDVGADWEHYDYSELIKKEFSVDPLTTTAEDVRAVLESRHISFDPNGFNLERGVDLLWKQIRKSLSGPGFLTGIPVYLEPLAKRSEKDPRTVERFQIILAGSEMGKGFSELNDPIDQAERFAHQQALREAGDDEAQMNDDSFVEALEYGMPPTFGFGISERLFSFLEGVSIREGQLFPLMRPKDEREITKSKEHSVAVAVIKRSGLEPWQILNAVGHLAAELGIREGRRLLYQDTIKTKDGETIPLNMQHALMLKEVDDGTKLHTLLAAARQNGLSVAAFTREMIETTSDKKVIDRTAQKNIEDIEFLGVLVFGPVSVVDALTGEFSLYS